MESDERPWDHGPFVRRDCEPHRGRLVFALGVISLVLNIIPPVAFGLGLTAWLLARNDLVRMRGREMDPAGKFETDTGRICGLIAALLGFGYMALYALLMLAIRP